ncbi:MAG: prolipoprotein diacylglyceryl transferase [Desulfobulbaceae bacterium]|nr:prolipoprotein diacylglyceryl transferase [Desulfobulbaceae bacterium]
MIAFPNIDPVIFELGPLQIRWYGLMYVLAFVATYVLVRYQIKKFGLKKLESHFENLNFILIICLVVGARLGYVLFYNFGYYLKHPLEILATWQGGMSFHGGLLGVVIGGIWFCRKRGLDFLETADIYCVTFPIGLGLGRLGNFINGELFGRVSDVPWAMVFPDGGPAARHPSQLYEFLLEGVLLFVILWTVKSRRPPAGTMLGYCWVFYGLFRCFVEFFRQPDANLGLFFGFMTMGQVLSGFMIVAGLFLLATRNWKRPVM